MTDHTDIPDQRWCDVREMLINIVIKFGDVLDATGLVPRDRMRMALAWLRDAEAYARALVLSMALEVVLGPVPRWAARVRAKTLRAGKPLFRFRYGVARRPRVRSNVKVFMSSALRDHLERQRAEDAYQREMFGRRVEKCWTNRAPLPAREGANHEQWRTAHAPSLHVSREAFRLRYNAVAMAVENPAPFAQRMARRLARDRATTIRHALTRAPDDARIIRGPFWDLARDRIAETWAEVDAAELRPHDSS